MASGKTGKFYSCVLEKRWPQGIAPSVSIRIVMSRAAPCDGRKS